MRRRELIAGGTLVVLGTITGCTGDGTGGDGTGGDGTGGDGTGGDGTGGDGTGGDGTGGDGTGGNGTADGPAGYSGSGTESYHGTWTNSEVSGTWEFTVDWDTGEITGSTSGDVVTNISGTAEAGTIDAEGEAAMGTVTWTGTFSADGASVSGEWSGLGDAGTWSGERTPDDETPADTTAEPTEESPGETTTDETRDETADGDTDAILYGELFTLKTNYTVDIEFTHPETGESVTATVKYDGGDYYMTAESVSIEGDFEVYHVEDDDYVVLDGEQCFVNPGPTAGPDSDVESRTDAEAHGTLPDADLEPTGTTQIDGERVYVFEVTGEDIDGVLTFYVSAETGYLRRVEGAWGTATFHSWGETEPISKPDMDCQEVGY